MIYVHGGVEMEVTVVERDDTMTPPSILIKMPNGRERETEAWRLSRPKKRQASPSAAETVSMHRQAQTSPCSDNRVGTGLRANKSGTRRLISSCTFLHVTSMPCVKPRLGVLSCCEAEL